MDKRAKAGACLEALDEMAISLLQEAERQLSADRAGSPPTIADWLIGVLIIVQVAVRVGSQRLAS